MYNEQCHECKMNPAEVEVIIEGEIETVCRTCAEYLNEINILDEEFLDKIEEES